MRFLLSRIVQAIAKFHLAKHHKNALSATGASRDYCIARDRITSPRDKQATRALTDAVESYLTNKGVQ